jgi:DNA replication protein DnaD
MQDATVIVSLIGLFSTIVASVFGAMAWSQKKLVEVLEKQIIAGEKREQMMAQDNKEQGITISKMGTSIDKLTEQGAQTIRLLEDVVYGRQQAQQHRRNQ